MIRHIFAALFAVALVTSARAASFEGLAQSLYEGRAGELSYWVGTSPECPLSAEQAYQAVHAVIMNAGVTPLSQSMGGIELSVTVSCIASADPGNLAAYVRIQFDNTTTSPDGQFRPTQGNYDEIVFAPESMPGEYVLGVVSERTRAAVADFVESNQR